MPVSKRNRFLKPKAQVPLFAKPNQLILEKSHNLLGGVYFCVDGALNLGDKTDDEKNVIQLLNLMTNLKWSETVASFKMVTELDSKTKSNESDILRYCISFYRFVGRDSNQNQIISDDLTTKSIRINNMWIDVKDVFQTPSRVSGIYDWRSLVGDQSDTLLLKGLKRLGVKECPSATYLANHLIKGSNYRISEKLSDMALFEVKDILSNLSRFPLNNIQNCPSFPILGGDNLLHHQEDIFLDDLPAYHLALERNNNIHFVAADFTALAKMLERPGLEKGGEVFINEERSEIVHQGLTTEFFELEQYLQQPFFKDGLIRLISDRKNLDFDEMNSLQDKAFTPQKFVHCESLFIDYFIGDLWVYTDNGSSCHLDKSSLTLYLLAKADVEDMVDEVTVFIANEFQLDGIHHQCLSRIIRNKMGFAEIELLLNKKNMKALPEAYKVYDNVIKLDEEYGAPFYNSNDELTNDNDIDILSSDREEPLRSDNNNERRNNSSRISKTESNAIPKSAKVNLVNTVEPQRPPTRKLNGTLSLLKQRKYTSKGTFDSTTTSANSGVDIPPPIEPKVSSSNSITPSDQSSPKTSQTYSQQNSNDTEVRKIATSNSRYPVYVANDSEDLDNLRNSDEKATKIGDEGEDFVLANFKDVIINSLNHLVKAKTNQKGYDITEVSENGDIVRYIEVKTCRRDWDELGVSVTPSQFEFAHRHENWWLVIVENIAVESVGTSITQIENPVKLINQFRFDESWRQMKAQDIQPKLTQQRKPEVGCVYYVPELDEEFKIVSLESRGAFFKIAAKSLVSGNQIPLKFDSSWRRK